MIEWIPILRSAMTLAYSFFLLGDLCFAYAKTEDDLGGKIYKISEFNEQIDRAAGGSYTKVTVNRGNKCNCYY